MGFEDQDVVINVTANDKTGNALNSIRSNFRSLGRELNMVGMTMTAAFTVPIVAAFVGMNKFGKDASTQVATLKKNLDDALASGNADKIAAAQAAWDALTPAIKDTAAAYDAMTKAIQPAKDELQAVGAELMTALVPVVQQLAPLLVSLVGDLKQVVDWFSALPLGTKDAILGVVAFLAVMGPGVMIIAKGVEVIGALAGIAEHLGVVLPMASAGLKEFGASAYAALGPIGALILALGLLYTVWQKFGGQAQTTVNQMGLLAGRAIFGDAAFKAAIATPEVPVLGKAGGGGVRRGSSYVVGEQGPELFTPGSSGYITPNGASNFTLIYSPAVSMATQDEVERRITPAVLNVLHRKMGNAHG